MKKNILIYIFLILCTIFLYPKEISAASSASLTGPGTIRAGDNITLNLNINGINIYGASGTLNYDTNQLTLVETKQSIASPWMVEFNGNNFVSYDNNLSAPINSNKSILKVTFKIKNVTSGTTIKVSYTNVKLSDGNQDQNIGTVTYSKTISAPLSTNNNLSSITINNATLSPNFSENNTNYSVNVPFSVSKLNITAKAADDKAKISINNPTLTANSVTNVTITVTAENGAKKTYTIAAKRAQDPNYVPSSNNNLSEIKVEGFLLSPVFKAELTEYVVWVPYETTNVKVSGKSSDAKAAVKTVGGDNLLAGQDNQVKVICTAENGAKKEYTIIVKRAADHNGNVDQPKEEPKSEIPEAKEECETEKGEIAWYWPIITTVIGCFVGIVSTMYITKNNNKSTNKSKKQNPKK